MPHPLSSRTLLAGGLLLAALAPTAAIAGPLPPSLDAPGLGDEVYGATVDAHEVELETRYGVMSDGAVAGQDNFRLEAAYGVSSNLRVAVVGEFERDPGQPNRATHLGFEAIYHLGRVAGVDIAAYGEFEAGLNGNPNSTEAKLLLQRRSGLWDLRFNLIGEKPLVASEPLALSYATSIDRAVASNLRLGVTAFGQLGRFTDFLPHAEHYVGPTAKIRVPLGGHDADGKEDGGLLIETGYLFATSAASPFTTGQFRLNIEMEL